VVLDLGLDQDKVDQSVTGLRLDGVEALLDPAGGPKSTQDLSHVVYAGPLDGDVFAANEPTKSVGLTGLIVHNMGGPCSFCTFGWLTGLLLWLLQLLHSASHDWALSIMLLVLVVRTCLHPVTKWSQIRMTRFGKQMQNIGPKMKVLQEKFKDDKVRLQQETGRLWREEGISPTGMLGCLPMFFQMPVWIALYATLFFAVELRHQPAFFGVFQAVQGAGSPFRWFFGDLAEPDRLWYWGTTFKIPLLGWGLTSLNVMPFILGVVFFIQQKYLKPPTTATLTPEQETQQKMVQYMSVFLFPIMMYPAPSGLTLYFCTNSVLSILENRYIRRHIDELDKNPRPIKSRPGTKGGNEKTGFMARMMAAAEAKRREMEESQAKAMKNAKKKR
jgi:YidC/Oxa1 family membrane protein insertase